MSASAPGNSVPLRGYSPKYFAGLVIDSPTSALAAWSSSVPCGDSLMTGAKYGMYDLEWVLHALRIDQLDDRIYVESKGLYAVEEYLQARYYMFRQVYFHRTLRSADSCTPQATTGW